jgi:transcriptional regulator with XRE-family HTH domain
MRRLMLGMSQSNVADALRVTFQQVQKYEKGTNRIGAGRLQHISKLLHVPIDFFFEGAPQVPGQDDMKTGAPFPQYVSDYLASSDGIHLTEAFMRIPNLQLRRSIVDLVEQIADCEDE